MTEIQKTSRPIDLRRVRVSDTFWQGKMELVRKEVLPYQWETLNDRVEGASPSFCMRNFRIAGKLMQEKHEKGKDFVEPKYTYRGFEALPMDMEHMEDDKFYGFVFQDSDFSKWIEAVGYSLIAHPDPELEKVADGAIDIVCAAQQDNGYLDTYYIINGMDRVFTNLRDHHELYCFGHLVEGAVSYYKATGKDKLLNAARRFADHVCEVFGNGEGQKKGYPGHEIAEMALVRLYEVTGEQKYLELARFFLDERGKQPYYWATAEEHDNRTDYRYHQAHMPVRDQDEAVGHAVRAVYLYSGMADVAGLTHDESLYEACRSLWKSATHEKMYITGGIGGTSLGEAFSYPFDLPNDLAYAETCASIGLVFWARRMLELEPLGEYADVMEQALYNTVLSGMALDGKSFFYVNPLEADPKACELDGRKSHVKAVRRKWFGCACCPPNLARLISSIPSYAYTVSEDTLFMHLYMGGTVDIGDGASFTTETEYPWKDEIRIRYHGSARSYTLAIRIPGWSDDVSLSGAVGKEVSEEKGYMYVSGEWQEGDLLQFVIPLEVRVCTADERVREDRGKIAVMRGPIVFCAEERDNGADLHLLSLDPNSEFEIGEVNICGEQFMTLTGEGRRIVPQASEGLYRAYKRVRSEKTKVTLIPYFAWANRGENEMSVWLRSGNE